MSGQCTGWVLRHGPRPEDTDREGKPYGLARARAMRAVLVPVADAANRDGTHAHPGIEAVIEASLYSRRQVYRVLDDLMAEGWLRVEQLHSPGRATEYTVDMGRRGATMAPVEGATTTPAQVPPATPTGAKSEGQRCHPGGTPNGMYNGSYNETPAAEAAPPSVPHVARELVKVFHEERRAAGQPGVAKFIGAVKVVQAMLAAGHEPDALAWAMRHAPTVSTGALEVALSRRPRAAAAQADRAWDRDEESGVLEV